MAWACATDKGQQTDQKCTSVEANREKIKRTTKQKMDRIEEDLQRTSVTKCGKQQEDNE